MNYLQAFFIERPLIETEGNLVILCENKTFNHTAIPEILQIADIIQGRFGWAPFLIGIDETPIANLPGTFELA